MSDMLAGGLILMFIALAIAGMVFWIWALVDAIRVPDDSLYKSGTKLVWVLVIALVGWIGALIYLVVGRPDGGATAAIAAWGGGANRPLPPTPDTSVPPRPG